MSKYAALRAVMGGIEQWNDKGTNGRILKWEASTVGADIKSRKAAAAEILEQLRAAGVSYVQKVMVSNSKTSNVYFVGAGKGTNGGSYWVSEYASTDKIAVYINAI